MEFTPTGGIKTAPPRFFGRVPDRSDRALYSAFVNQRAKETSASIGAESDPNSNPLQHGPYLIGRITEQDVKWMIILLPNC